MVAERVGALKPKGSGKPGISVVGAGRMGTALAIALARAGYRVDALVARRLSHARRAARLTGASPLALSSAQLDRLPTSDILFITTPDDAIESTATELAATFAGSVKSASGGSIAR